MRSNSYFVTQRFSRHRCEPSLTQGSLEITLTVPLNLIYMNANRLSSTIEGQQRNEPIIQDVTSVKYNKENKIFSHQMTCFPRLNKKV